MIYIYIYIITHVVLGGGRNKTAGVVVSESSQVCGGRECVGQVPRVLGMQVMRKEEKWNRRGREQGAGAWGGLVGSGRGMSRKEEGPCQL